MASVNNQQDYNDLLYAKDFDHRLISDSINIPNKASPFFKNQPTPH